MVLCQAVSDGSLLAANENADQEESATGCYIFLVYTF